MKITGLDRLAARFDVLPEQALEALGQALYVEGETIMTRSKQVFVPVDLGVLRASGHVKQPVVRDTAATVMLGYGGAASAYALIQHENTKYRHTVGESGYLRKPVEAAKPGLEGRLGGRIKRTLEKKA